jgi:hypothetical protein
MTREQNLAETLELVQANMAVLARNPTAIDVALRTEILLSMVDSCKSALNRQNYDEVTA